MCFRLYLRVCNEKCICFYVCHLFAAPPLNYKGSKIDKQTDKKEENNKIILELMKKYEMPCCIEDMGIDKTRFLFRKKK